jgi:hypothetical protein
MWHALEGDKVVPDCGGKARRKKDHLEDLNVDGRMGSEWILGSTLAKHSINLVHRIQLHDTSTLAKKTRYMDRIIREAIETELYFNNINREDGFSFSRSRKPLICDLREQNPAANKNMMPSGGP